MQKVTDPTCQAQLNTWCDSHCPHFQTHGSLIARYDTTQHGTAPAWRCYAESTLTSDLAKYESGDKYCTRHPMLVEQLEECQTRSEAYSSEAEFGPDGDGDGKDEACANSVAECVLCAKYDECNQNMAWMFANCPSEM